MVIKGSKTTILPIEGMDRLTLFAALKATVSLRVTKQEEVFGLDAKHGVRAYPVFLPAPGDALLGED